MHFVGGVEIFAGLLVLLAPRIGAFVVAAWLGGIVINLLTVDPPTYYDIALRDFGLMLAALTLGRLALAVVPGPKVRGAARPALVARLASTAGPSESPGTLPRTCWGGFRETSVSMARKRKIVGAHLSPRKPLEEAESVGADCVQIFLSDPQGWKKPPPRKDADRAAGLEGARSTSTPPT